jgi:predicted CxxxxCH...CXXCH cytochrome family protein
MELREITKIMKLIMKYILFYLSAIIFSIYFAGCSDLETDIPQPQKMTIHGAGIITPSSPEFHGNLVKQNNWDLTLCKDCHGANYDGGLVNKSCLNCHIYPQGPENCTTCHGSKTSNAPPKDLNGNYSTSDRGVGAHQAHLKVNSVGRFLTCTECHNVPGGLYTQGHVDSELPAEVLMNNFRANVTTNDDSSLFNYFDIDPNQIRYIPNPIYNSLDLTCSNTYCHGYFKNGNVDNKPVWTDPTSSECGSCHGDGSNPIPKIPSQGGSHPTDTDCYLCHGGVVDANLNIINPSKHIDGLLNLYGNDIKY